MTRYQKEQRRFSSYIAPNYGITIEEWNHDGNHVHVMFLAQPKTEIRAFACSAQAKHR